MAKEQLVQNGTPELTSAEQIPSEWSIESLDDVKDIAPSKFDSEKPWMATHYKIERPDGTTEDIESTKTILKIKNLRGEEVEVPAFALEHIMSLHVNGKEAGGTLEGGSLASSFGIVAEHLPDQLPFQGDAAAFEVNVGQTTGTEGVSSQQEMLEKGVATEGDIEMLATVKDDVFRLNIEGTEEEKNTFVDGFNEKVSGNVKLGVRGGAITPFFSTEKQPTSKMFLVVGKETDPDGSEHNRVWTMTPGRYMDKLPTDGSFTGRYGSDGIPEGTSIADISRKAHAGEELSEAEISFLDKQKLAQECWWNGGFIVSPEKE